VGEPGPNGARLLMTRAILVYAKFYTTSVLFAHVVKFLLDHRASETQDVYCHLLFDDRRDRDLAQSLLDPARVTCHALYEHCHPWHEKSWSSERIRRWEKLYGTPHLKGYTASERILKGVPSGMHEPYVIHHIEYYENLLRDVQPVLFVAGPADALPAWVAIRVFQRNNIPILILSPSRFGRRCFLPEDPHEHLGIRRIYEEKVAKGLAPEDVRPVDELIQQYRDRRVKPADYWAVSKAIRPRVFPRPNRLFREIHAAFRTDRQYYDERLCEILGRAFKARLNGFCNWYLRSRTLRAIPSDRPFFFFPLQVEPEMALSTQGRGWTDQLALIRLISECLPIDRYLYVKEHPMMSSGVRTLAFYKAVLKLPCVRLVDQFLDSYAIVPQAEAVITLGSTTGWEALMFNRPVLLAGRAFYEEFREGVVPLNDIEQLPHLLREMRHRVVSDDAIRCFAAAVFTKAPNAFLGEPRLFPELAGEVLSSDNFERISTLILNKLNGLTACTENKAPAGAH